MQSTALMGLSEYLKSLQKINGDCQLLPVKQLLVIVTDLMTACEEVHVKEKVEIGYFDFVKQSYYKKHPAQYDKYMSQFLKSLIKHSKPNTELSFYATLLSSNVDSQILVPVSKAVSILKKKLALGVVSEGRNDDLCRKVKLSYAEVVESCKKIFAKACPFSAKEYEELTEKNIKHRVRDYILKIQSHSSILESNGLTFLEIVLREAALVRDELDHLQEQLNDEENQGEEDNFEEGARAQHSVNPSPRKNMSTGFQSSTKTPELKKASAQNDTISSGEKSKQQSSGKKRPLYGISKVMGEELPKMRTEEIMNIKQMHDEDARFFAQPQQGNNADVGRFSSGNEDQYQVPVDVTFNDIYTDNILNKREDKVCLEVIRDCQTLENKIKLLRSEMDAMPKIDEAVDNHKHKIVNTIHQRKTMAKFMNDTLEKLDERQDIEMNEDVLEQACELWQFYEMFSKDVDKLLGMMSVIERHSLTEYIANDQKDFDSRASNRKNSQNVDNVSDISEVKHEQQSPFMDRDAVPLKTPEKAKSKVSSSNESPASRLIPGERDTSEYHKDVSRYMIKLHESSHKKQYDSQQEFEYHEKAVQLMMEEEAKINQDDYSDGEELRPVRKTNRFSGRKVKKVHVNPTNCQTHSSIEKSKSRSRIKIKEPQNEPPVARSQVLSQTHESSLKATPGPKKTHSLLNIPDFPRGLDRSLYENMIYDGKRRKMFIVTHEHRPSNKNCVSLRLGDVVCCVKDIDDWSLVYYEDNPKKYGFYPACCLSFIN